MFKLSKHLYSKLTLKIFLTFGFIEEEDTCSYLREPENFSSSIGLGTSCPELGNFMLNTHNPDCLVDIYSEHF